MRKRKCLVCGSLTPNGFNINLRDKPICEECANAIAYEQVKFLTSFEAGFTKTGNLKQKPKPKRGERR